MIKTFNSVNAIKKYFFPEDYKKEMDQQVNNGEPLTKEFLRKMRRKLKRNK